MAPLCVNHYALSQLSSAGATLVAPKSERSYPAQNLPFPAHLPRHCQDHGAGRLKDTTPFILERCAASTKLQTLLQRQIQRSEADQALLTESSSRAPSLQRAPETQVRAHHCHLAIASQRKDSRAFNY